VKACLGLYKTKSKYEAQTMSQNYDVAIKGHIASKLAKATSGKFLSLLVKALEASVPLVVDIIIRSLSSKK
jgi:hypothetical protein